MKCPECENETGLMQVRGDPTLFVCTNCGKRFKLEEEY